MTANTPGATIDNNYTTDHSYREFMGTDTDLLPDWQTFFSSLAQLGPEERREREQNIYRMLRENGVTYNIYGDPSGLNRPWNLDIIPYFLSRRDWQKVETGLVQRAEILNLALQDIYGEQKLIKNGILPAELVYGHGGFLRQCVGIRPIHPRSLVLYAADMARSKDGKLWVLNDRTQAPSGSGYALENRLAMARIVPELFSGLQVRHLSSFFDTMRKSLYDFAPFRKQDTRIVILTPGSSNETYFEHSYLSSYLGFALVQGNDLMVKDNFVWLKTIGGLEKVDVILRRVDDVFCDPLELREDSQLGIPGLLQAVRSGNVTIANPLGAGILENPGLMPFLHAVAKYFLNEDLVLSNIASWWCGQEKERNHVLENISSLVIKKIWKGLESSNSIDGGALSTAELETLKQQIKAHPYLYVGQEKVDIAHTPSLVNGNIESGTALFRSFLVGNEQGYTTMPGGLTRTAQKENKFIVSNQMGSVSKDTWVIAPEPENIDSFKAAKTETSITTEKRYITSRTAENLFWVGRNAERVLGNARFIRNVLQSSMEGNRHHQNELEAERYLLEAITHYTATYPGFLEEEEEEAAKKFRYPWSELKYVLFDGSRPGSLLYNFNLFCRGVYSERDHWSTDTWRLIWNMEEDMNNTSLHLSHIKARSVLDSLITSMVAFIGLNGESISREQGWVIMDIGRKLERSLLLISMLRNTVVDKHEDSVDYNLYESLLKSNEALVNYRYKYKRPLEHSLVLELMLLDSNNPRSLIYQLERLKTYLGKLPRMQQDPTLPAHEKIIFEAHAALLLAGKETFTRLHKKTNQYRDLDDLLSHIYELLSQITPVISKTYFTHVLGQKQLFTVESF